MRFSDNMEKGKFSRFQDREKLVRKNILLDCRISVVEEKKVRIY